MKKGTLVSFFVGLHLCLLAVCVKEKLMIGSLLVTLSALIIIPGIEHFLPDDKDNDDIATS